MTAGCLIAVGYYNRTDNRKEANTYIFKLEILATLLNKKVDNK